MPSHQSSFPCVVARPAYALRRAIASLLGVVGLVVLGGTADSAPSERYDHGDPTVWEQVLLERVNRARADPEAEADRHEIDLNEGLEPGTISPEPKPPLAMHPRLIAAAREHSEWMLAHDEFSHTGEGGSTVTERIESAGYILSGSWATGENLSQLGTTGTLNMPSAVESMHEGLFHSPGHRRNMLSPDFVETGWGVIRGDVERDDPNNGGTHTWDVAFATEKFARSGASPGPFLVGVVSDDRNGNRQYDAGEGVDDLAVRPGAGQYYARTSASGGYAIPLGNMSGSLAVTLSGENWPNTITRYIELTGDNIKLDFSTADILYWIGDYTEVPPLIYHAEHAWMYAHWSAHDNVYVYDFRMDSWLWTAEGIYPYLYKFGSDPGWLFFFRGTVAPDRSYYHFGHDRAMTEGELIPD